MNKLFWPLHVVWISSNQKTKPIDPKNRSGITEHPKQNNKNLTPALGGQFTPVKVAKSI